MHRDKTTIAPLEWVSLDGRMQDYWIDWGDGKPAQGTMIALVDCASNYVLGCELTPSENAAATQRLIKSVCQRHGIFDRLYTDNGVAFTGHLIAGGTQPRYRHSGSQNIPKTLGICSVMGIDIINAGVGNARAKIAERAFGTLSRVIDDRPEFQGAHAGHAPGASPSANVTPMLADKALAILRREIRRHNKKAGRRSQGARGRSYEQVFCDGLMTRIVRKPTERQLYLSGLIYRPVAVDRNGQVTVDAWIYGGPSTEEALLRHHGKGRRVLLERDPDDFGAPALAFDDSGHLMCEGIDPVQRSPYGSVDVIREAARLRKHARDRVAEAHAANLYDRC